MRNFRPVVAATVLLALLTISIATADEGMWTFDNPPIEHLQEIYDFTPTEAWLNHVRLASVRLGDGGSGSFVSPDGLVLTNHHVAFGQLQKLSTPETDYVSGGFLARTRDEERKCADLEINVLVYYRDVTDRVLGASNEKMSDQEILEARQAVIAAIEKESLEETDLRSEVISLYHGGEYWLYRYQRFTDVRLVFAPESGAAYFGGDDDNFTFPRHDLDMALFRVYENDAPISSPDHLPLNPAGARNGDLTFVSGHPGSTDRLYTMAELAIQRDYTYPRTAARLDMLIDSLHEYAARGPEQARQAGMLIMGIANGQKVQKGEYEGLLNPTIWETKQREETAFRKRVAEDPEMQSRYGEAWSMIETAEQAYLERVDEMSYRLMPGYRLGRLAQGLVRLVQESQKPDSERLEGYHDSQLRRRQFRLFSPAPIYPEMETFLMARSLEVMVSELGDNDPFVRIALDRKDPAERARELVEGTKLIDPANRKALVEGGPAALEASTDPMIVMARNLEPMLREQHDWKEENVVSVETVAHEMLGAARFAIFGKSTYPDANFTLRLSFGRVAGYPMNGTRAPSRTTFHGLLDRAYSFDLEPPFKPTDRLMARLDGIDLATPLNFVSTHDITGGNSGSPVIDREGRLVGLIFDGNIESLSGRFVYDDTAGRAVSVHAAAIDLALRELYDAGFLADEMRGDARTAR